MINGATINNAGKVYIHPGAGVPAYYKDGLPYTIDGALMITIAGAIEGYSAGIPFSNGRPCWTFNNAAAPLPADTQYQCGFATNAEGRVYYTTQLPPVSYNLGWPIAVNGAICATNQAPGLNGFTDGFSTGFD